MDLRQVSNPADSPALPGVATEYVSTCPESGPLLTGRGRSGPGGGTRPREELGERRIPNRLRRLSLLLSCALGFVIAAALAAEAWMLVFHTGRQECIETLVGRCEPIQDTVVVFLLLIRQVSRSS